MIIKLENGSTIEPMPSENNTSGIRATLINKPDHIELASETFEDRIEFRAFNTITREGRIAPFYFKEDESPAMSHIKQLRVIENLVNKVK